MSFWKKDEKAPVNTAPAEDAGIGTAADVDAAICCSTSCLNNFSILFLSINLPFAIFTARLKNIVFFSKFFRKLFHFF